MNPRHQAKIQVRESAIWESRGTNSSTRAGLALLREVLQLYQRGSYNEISLVIEKFRSLLQDVLLLCFLGSYLQGRKSTFNQLGKVLTLGNSPSSNTLSDAVEFLRIGLQMKGEDFQRLKTFYVGRAVGLSQQVSDGLTRRLNQALLESTSKGLHVSGGIKLVREAFESAGVTPRNPYVLESIYRTNTQMAYSAARWQSFQDEDVFGEILWGYEYVTTGDDRVRPAHALLDGFKSTKDDPIWRIIWTPNGWGCRCQIIPIFVPNRASRFPRPKKIDGVLVTPGPDKGWEFNPGETVGVGGSSVPKFIQKSLQELLPNFQKFSLPNHI